MAEPMIEATDEAFAEEFIEALSDQALDREDGSRAFACGGPFCQG